MLTENDVVDAVADLLVGIGYRIDQRLTTVERGVDIDAVQIATGKRLLVEAKGGTSSKETSNRFGKAFTPNQAKSHIAVAFYCVAKLRQESLRAGAAVALALPDDKVHRLLIEKISESLRQLKIKVFFVSEDRSVIEF